jgi:hypothetical protein
MQVTRWLPASPHRATRPDFTHCDLTDLDALSAAVGHAIGRVLWLAASDSRMCTAQNFIVDAGWV